MEWEGGDRATLEWGVREEDKIKPTLAQGVWEGDKMTATLGQGVEGGGGEIK